MSQNKEALMAELQDLTQELENMGNYFNSPESGDVGINDEEAVFLENIQNEIDLLQSEINSLNTLATPPKSELTLRVEEIEHDLSQFEILLKAEQKNKTFDEGINTMYDEIDAKISNTIIKAGQEDKQDVIDKLFKFRTQLENLKSRILVVKGIAQTQEEYLTGIDTKIDQIIQEKGGGDPAGLRTYIKNRLDALTIQINSLING